MKKYLRQSVIIFGAFFIIAFLSACASDTLKPFLKYSPITPSSLSNNITIQVSQFADTRSEDIIGNIRDNHGNKTADVVTDTNISEWVTDAVKSELKNAGYTIVEEKAMCTISGEVLKVCCDVSPYYEGEVRLKVTVKKDNNTLFDKMYSGRVTDLNWGSTAKSCGIILERSLQQAMHRIVTDVKSALR
ncbi:MAG: YajG family lipoprotein [Candidatus Omnitrophica bacterium]|nr:YajG family lipoprotein [Candidatus Omnitrophota bacterium]